MTMRSFVSMVSTSPRSRARLLGVNSNVVLVVVDSMPGGSSKLLLRFAAVVVAVALVCLPGF